MYQYIAHRWLYKTKNCTVCPNSGAAHCGIRSRLVCRGGGLGDTVVPVSPRFPKLRPAVRMPPAGSRTLSLYWLICCALVYR